MTQVSTIVPLDIGAEVDEARHQDHVPGDVRRAAHDRARHGAKAGLRNVLAPTFQLEGTLSHHFAVPAAVDQRIVVEAEAQQHGLLQPLIDLPRVRPGRAWLFGDPRLAAGRAGPAPPPPLRAPRPWSPADIGAVLPGLVDQRLKAEVGHGGLTFSAPVCLGRGARFFRLMRARNVNGPLSKRHREGESLWRGARIRSYSGGLRRRG